MNSYISLDNILDYLNVDFELTDDCELPETIDIVVDGGVTAYNSGNYFTEPSGGEPYVDNAYAANKEEVEELAQTLNISPEKINAAIKEYAEEHPEDFADVLERDEDRFAPDEDEYMERKRGLYEKRNMKQNVIRLSESQLMGIVTESVKSVLNEMTNLNEGWFSREKIVSRSEIRALRERALSWIREYARAAASNPRKENYWRKAAGNAAKKYGVPNGEFVFDNTLRKLKEQLAASQQPM